MLGAAKGRILISLSQLCRVRFDSAITYEGGSANIQVNFQTLGGESFPDVFILSHGLTTRLCSIAVNEGFVHVTPLGLYVVGKR